MQTHHDDTHHDKANKKMVEVNGANLWTVSIGTGSPILVMHGGLGLSHDYLRPYFDQLSVNHTIVYYDHFGNGRSDKPEDYAEMTFERLISDAAELMSTLGHKRFSLIGHSYGGFIAQEFAATHSDRLEGLIIVDSVPAFDYHPTVSGTEEQMACFARLFSEPMIDDKDWQETWGQVIKTYFHQWDETTGNDLDARTVYEHRAWNAGAALLGTFNSTNKLPNITTPTLTIAGAHDGITPAEPGAERIAALMPNAELKIFADSAHYPFIEEQAAFFECITRWLAK